MNRYCDADLEHAFLLRCEGMSYRKIGERLGVNKERVRQLLVYFSKRMRRAMVRTRVYLVTEGK